MGLRSAKDWAARLTGFSTPLFGVSWSPPKLDRDIALSLINFLEDRRVLYSPSELELPHHCVLSVMEIRQHLTNLLTGLDRDGILAAHLQAMRAACRYFLDRIHLDGRGDFEAMASHGHWQSWEFNGALGQMRGVFGVHLAFVAARFEIEIRDGLEAILPSAPTEEERNA
jgi:hypothetical protein